MQKAQKPIIPITIVDRKLFMAILCVEVEQLKGANKNNKWMKKWKKTSLNVFKKTY